MPKTEQFTAKLPSTKIELKFRQSPRGLREGNSRIKSYDIKIDNNYNYLELCKLVAYLDQLTMSMEH